MFATLGHVTQYVGLGIARIPAFLGMKGKKLVPNHPFEIVTRGNKVKCLFFTQSSEFDGVGCKDGCFVLKKPGKVATIVVINVR